MPTIWACRQRRQGALVAIEAGWYLDPTGAFDRRYWDGQRWTDRVQGDDGVEASAPLSGGIEVVRIHGTSGSGEVAAEGQGDAGGAVLPFSRAVTGAATLEPKDLDQDTTGSTSARSASGSGDVVLRSLREDPPGVRYARAMLSVAGWIGLVSLAITPLVVTGPIAIVGGMIALVLAMVGRGRLTRLAHARQHGALRSALVGVLAALMGVVATAILAATFVHGDVARAAACITTGGESLLCAQDYLRVAWGKFSL